MPHPSTPSPRAEGSRAPQASSGAGLAGAWPGIAPARGVDSLTDHECRHLLHRCQVGRLGLTSASLPVILPVGYTMDGAAPVFCVGGDGLELNAARHGHVACFEIDDVDHSGGHVRSVLVIGRLSEIVGASRRANGERLSLPGWDTLDDPHLLHLEPTVVSGRRLDLADPSPMARQQA